jgi:hypothetical protein
MSRRQHCQDEKKLVERAGIFGAARCDMGKFNIVLVNVPAKQQFWSFGTGDFNLIS